MVSITNCTYPVVETFHSVQGEGFWTGVNAFFIRLAGCDVGCPWCDQKESWNPKRHPRMSVEELGELVTSIEPAIVIITGGEPLLHDLTPLTATLKARGARVHLETSGAYPLSGDIDWVTLSPKPYKIPVPGIYPRVSELKIVVAGERDLEWAESQKEKVPANVLKYLQPEWNTGESRELVFNYVLKHPEWRVSLQTHKFLGVR